MVATPATDASAAERQRLEDARFAGKWIAELGVSEKAQAKWLTKARKIQKLYGKQGSETAEKRSYAMLWSNTETTKPAVYARAPAPVVSRRFKDEDPVGRIASEALERALLYTVECQKIDDVLLMCRDDFVLISRAQAWVRYVPTHGDEVVPRIPVVQITDAAGETTGYRSEDTQEEFDLDAVQEDEEGFFAQGEPYRPVTYEEVVVDFVAPDDFGHSPARTWREVTYVWRRAFMDRDQLIERFGEETGKQVPLDWSPKATQRKDDVTQFGQKACVYEIWDKSTKEAIWVSKAWPHGPLDRRKDPLGLKDFFPCPRPLLGTVVNDGLFPTPDYVYYQDQAEEIDELTAKIGELQDSLKVVGLYAGEAADNLDGLMAAKNTKLIPVANWLKMKESGGIEGNVLWWPLDKIVAAIQACIELRRQLIEDVYQITGVSDIMRGASDPSATATAERIKGRWGPLRVGARQKEIARFARDIVEIMGEVIAEHFGVDTLAQMTGLKLPRREEQEAAQLQVQQLQVQAQAQAQQQAAMAAQQPQQPGQPPQPGQMGHNGGPPMQPQIPPEIEQLLAQPSWEDIKELLSNNALRQFRIDIETDSTIQPDEQEDKENATELLTALGAFISQWGPVVQSTPAMAPLVAELLKWALRRFRAGRELEEVVDRAMKEMQQAGGPQQPGAAAEAPKGPSPEEVAVKQAAVQVQAQRVQVQAQKDQMDAQIKQGHLQIDAAKLDLERQQQAIDAVMAARDPNPQVIQ